MSPIRPLPPPPKHIKIKLTALERDRFRRKWRAYEKRSGKSRTGQRDLIIELLLRAGRSVTTEELLRRVKKHASFVGRSTVTRALNNLVRANLADQKKLHWGIWIYYPRREALVDERPVRPRPPKKPAPPPPRPPWEIPIF